MLEYQPKTKRYDEQLPPIRISTDDYEWFLSEVGRGSYPSLSTLVRDVLKQYRADVSEKREASA